MTEPALADELFTCDRLHHGPTSGIWIADMDAEVPTDMEAPLGDAYTLIGTSGGTTVTDEPPRFDESWLRRGDFRVLTATWPQVITIEWTARASGWWRTMGEPIYRRLIVQPGAERIGWHPPLAGTPSRFIAHCTSLRPVAGGLTTVHSMHDCDGIRRWSLFVDPSASSELIDEDRARLDHHARIRENL